MDFLSVDFSVDKKVVIIVYFFFFFYTLTFQVVTFFVSFNRKNEIQIELSRTWFRDLNSWLIVAKSKILGGGFIQFSYFMGVTYCHLAHLDIMACLRWYAIVC